MGVEVGVQVLMVALVLNRPLLAGNATTALQQVQVRSQMSGSSQVIVRCPGGGGGVLDCGGVSDSKGCGMHSCCGVVGIAVVMW